MCATSLINNGNAAKRGGFESGTMLQLTRKGLIHHGQLDALRDRFATNHCVVLEKILEPALLENVQRQIGEARWQSSAYGADW